MEKKDMEMRPPRPLIKTQSPPLDQADSLEPRSPASEWRFTWRSIGIGVWSSDLFSLRFCQAGQSPIESR